MSFRAISNIIFDYEKSKEIYYTFDIINKAWEILYIIIMIHLFIFAFMIYFILIYNLPALFLNLIDKFFNVFKIKDS